jgi:hypothetical protein
MYFLIQNYVTQGVFCNGTRRNAVSEIISQKDARRNSVPEHFSFLVFVQLTSPLSDRIFGHSLRFGTFLKRKIALM